MGTVLRLGVRLVIVAALAGPAAAQHLGTRQPPSPTKPDPAPLTDAPPRAPIATPDDRQGGDTIFDAIAIPGTGFHIHSGTTAGYVDDYDEVCPYPDSTSPDVVYSFTSPCDGFVSADMCGSTYDTKIYVYDEALNVVACNDDFYFDEVCGQYVSNLESVPVVAGHTYYLVIDGYGGDYGDHQLMFGGCPPPPPPSCPPEGVLEGEPPLQDDYLDSWNGGCNSSEFGAPFELIPASNTSGETVFCGVAGWYDFEGQDYRDTDWLTMIMGPTGTIEVTAEVEWGTWLYELLPHDCEDVAVQQSVGVSPASPAVMTITGYDPGEVVWLWVGSQTFSPPPGAWGNEYDYILEITGLAVPVATETTSWGAVKSLYR